MERSISELACSVNALRNKDGTGHGRTFLLNIIKEEAKFCIECIGIVSEYLLTIKL